MSIAKLITPAPELIRFNRKLSGLKMREICERLGISYKTRGAINEWESGKHVPTLQTLSRLAAAYGCDISDFYLIDLHQISILARSVVIGFFNDPESNREKAAWIAARLLSFYAKRESKQKSTQA